MGNVYSLSDRKFKLDPFILGNKGKNLCDITRMNIPVPPGFILTTDVWKSLKEEKFLSEDIKLLVEKFILKIEKQTLKKFGNSKSPLFLSARSSSRYSMPGILDTVLDIGINDKIVKSLEQKIGKRAAYDSYRRLIQMYASVVYDIPVENFLNILDKSSNDNEERIVEKFKKKFKEETGEEFPQDVRNQLFESIRAIFLSWDSKGAKSYRNYNAISEDVGTAVIVQQMVFGNAKDSGSGVYFTRSPNSGDRSAVIEYIEKVQGEDVVGGFGRCVNASQDFDFKKQLTKIGRKLERHYQKPQDIEFTIENGKLWILQTRGLKYTGAAALKIASDMLEEKIVTESEASRLIQSEQISQVTQNTIDPNFTQKPFSTGIPASPGTESGILSFDQGTGKSLDDAIFFANHIDPNDLNTIYKSKGIVTTLGGAASHMAIIMRAAAKAGVVGASSIEIDSKAKLIRNDLGEIIKEGEAVSIDGSTGNIFKGKVPIQRARVLDEELREIIKIRHKYLGTSPWSAAVYKVDRKYQRRTFYKKIRKLLDESKWKSPKTRTIEILNTLFPPNEILAGVICSPEDVDKIRKAMISVIESGNINLPRTCHYPEKLSNAPWAYGPDKKSDVDKFLTGDFPGKYGGFREWVKDKTLEAVIVSNEPKGKLVPKYEKEHFVFTVSVLESSPVKILVSINPCTYHLRSFERVRKADVIMAEGVVNAESPNGIGVIRLHINGRVISYGDFEKKPGKFFDSKYKIRMIRGVVDKVFNVWWKPPIALPHMMSALDDAMGLSVLEGQGRVRNGKLIWCKVYGAKGYEEKEKVKNGN